MTDAELLRKQTPARIAVGRAGPRPTTKAWMNFRHAHAAAKDAVFSELSPSFIERFAGPLGMPVIQTLAADRQEFILNPPKGKQTTAANIQLIKNRCPSGKDVQIVICDGLSPLAIEATIE